MIYVARFWGQDHKASSLDDLHKLCCEAQETDKPEYYVKIYESEIDYKLRDIPQEFHAFITSYAWDRGHSSGQDEIDSVAEDLISQLKEPIEKFTTRIRTESRK